MHEVRLANLKVLIRCVRKNQWFRAIAPIIVTPPLPSNASEEDIEERDRKAINILSRDVTDLNRGSDGVSASFKKRLLSPEILERLVGEDTFPHELDFRICHDPRRLARNIPNLKILIMREPPIYQVHTFHGLLRSLKVERLKLLGETPSDYNQCSRVRNQKTQSSCQPSFPDIESLSEPLLRPKTPNVLSLIASSVRSFIFGITESTSSDANNNVSNPQSKSDKSTGCPQKKEKVQ